MDFLEVLQKIMSGNMEVAVWNTLSEKRASPLVIDESGRPKRRKIISFKEIKESLWKT